LNAASVVCVGILVADVFVPPLERLPGEGELVATDDFLVQPGGCAANVAIALQKLGVAAAVCGRVGDDAFGDFVERDLRSRGIETSSVLSTSGCSTSKTVIIPVVGEDRRYIHTFGANAALTAADISAVVLSGCDVVYIGGYLILPSLRERELAPHLLQARARGTKVVLDVAAPAGREPSIEDVSLLLPLADYFVPNVDEARALTGESDPGRQADFLLGHGARRVLIKLGDQGTCVRSDEIAFEMPAPRVKLVEPSGAGDAFAAGIIVGILEGWALERTVRFANVIGASACTALGCSAGVFTRSGAEALLATQPLPVRAVEST
jgi:sugar/nucleoside kinase (ribokinase family)